MPDDIPNEQQVNDQFNQQFTPGGYSRGAKIPNSVGVLVLGICSIIPGCMCYGFIGIICGIIALSLSKKAHALYKENPKAYSLNSYNNLKAGRICAIVGLCTSSILFLIVLFIFIFYVLIAGAAISTLPWSSF